jgi:hypothetical protein
MIKNTAGQKYRVFAFDATTGLPKTGDAANITCAISKDFGAFADLADTSATEEDSTKAKGYYLFDAAQTETNADDIGVTGRSSTSNIVVVGAPARIVTVPAGFGDLTIANNAVAANVTRLLGTAWLTPGTAGTPDVNAKLWNALTTVALPLVPTTAGRTLDVSATGEAGLDFDNIKDATGAHTLTNIRIPNVTLVDTLTTYTGNTPQTGDNFTRIGATGSGLTSLAPASTALSTGQWTNGRATLLDNLDAAVTSRMASYAQPAGFLAATFPGTVASPTNITAATGVRLSAAGVDDIWDEVQSGHTTSGTFGKYLDAQVSTISGGSLTAAAIADAVWDEAIAGHLAAGSTGAKLNAAASAGDPWTTDLSTGGYTGDQAGAIIFSIASGDYNVSGPAVGTNGAITLQRGDDYYLADSRTWDFNIPLSTVDITGGRVFFDIQRTGRAGGFLSLEANPANYVNAGATTQTVRFEMSRDPSSGSASLFPGSANYRVYVRKATVLHDITTHRGIATIVDKPG